MKFVLLLMSLGCVVGGAGPFFFLPPPFARDNYFVNRRIIGGRRVSVFEFPYQAAIRRKGDIQAFCGGSIIQQNWILTAAHCMKGENPGRLTVVVGTSDLRNVGIEVDIEKVVIHPLYGSMLHQNDLALIKTKKPVIMRGTAAITLPTRGQNFVGQKAQVSGFGTTSEGGSASPQLLATTLDVLSDSACTLSYWFGFRSNSMLCAGQVRGGQDSCQVCALFLSVRLLA